MCYIWWILIINMVNWWWLLILLVILAYISEKEVNWVAENSWETVTIWVNGLPLVSRHLQSNDYQQQFPSIFRNVGWLQHLILYLHLNITAHNKIVSNCNISITKLVHYSYSPLTWTVAYARIINSWKLKFNKCSSSKIDTSSGTPRQT